MISRPSAGPRLFGAAAALVLAAAGAAYPFQTPTAGQPAVPPLVVEDFEVPTLGAQPYLWKEDRRGASEATIGVERAEVPGNDANKALKYEYSFGAGFSASHGLEAGPGEQAMPGSMTGMSMAVHGDGSKNAVYLRMKDARGEELEWQIPVAWTGWKNVLFPFHLRPARTAGTKGNGTLDAPVTFAALGVRRTQDGARKGEIMVDNLTAVCNFGGVKTLYDTADGVKLDGWKANKNRSTIGLLADSLVPRGGKDVAVLKMEYEYENSGDSSVEFAKTLPAGEGHGTLIAEIFGDGSNNMIRFRMLDGADRPWQGTWATALVDWSGWKTLYIDTRTLRDPGGPDPTAMPTRFPLKFQSVILDDCSVKDNLPGVESGRKGEIFLGRLLFAAEK